MLPIKVEVLKDGLEPGTEVTDESLQVLENEAFCSKSVMSDTKIDDLCQVYVDKEIPGLSFAFFQVTLSGYQEKI